jgi:hypothetical protein
MVGRENLTWWLRLPSKDHIKDYASVAAAKNAACLSAIPTKATCCGRLHFGVEVEIPNFSHFFLDKPHQL